MKARLLPLMLVLVALGAYLGVLVRSDLKFVFDDKRFVEENLALRDLSRFTDFFTDPTTVEAASWSKIYRPLRTLDWAVDYAIYGTVEGVGAVRWFHFRNALYHALSTLLLFYLFLQWRGDRLAAALGALVFALHPVQAEAVGFITSRADVLCLVFFLAALLCHGRSRGFDRSMAGSAVFLALALLAKEAAIVFPAVAMLSDFVFRDGCKLKTTLRRWPTYLLATVLVGLYVFLWINRHQVYQGDLWTREAVVQDFYPMRVLTMARGFVYYARLLFLPVDLGVDVYIREVRSSDVLSILCGLGVLASLVFAMRATLRRGSLFGFAVVWFFLAIFPTSNLPVPLGIPTAERFLYMPSIGLALWAGSLLAVSARRGALGAALTGVVLLSLFLLTFERAQVWTNPEVLWGSTERYSSPRGIEWYAQTAREDGEKLQVKERELRDRNEIEAADRAGAEGRKLLIYSVKTYDRAINVWKECTLQPEPSLMAQSEQALSLFALKRFQLALVRSEDVLRQWPDLASAHYARSLALFGLGRLKASAWEIETALGLFYRVPYAKAGAGIYEKLATHYELEENPAQTFLALKRSWQLLSSEEANPAVARALREMEIEYRTKLLELKTQLTKHPDDALAWRDLACTHAAYGEYGEAAEIFDRLLEEDQLGRDPRLLGPYAFYHWQWRDTVEGYEKASEIYEEMLEQDPGRDDIAEELRKCRDALTRLRAVDR
jgi:tetratricopeptide (TPR) repeat protein